MRTDIGARNSVGRLAVTNSPRETAHHVPHNIMHLNTKVFAAQLYSFMHAQPAGAAESTVARYWTRRRSDAQTEFVTVTNDPAGTSSWLAAWSHSARPSKQDSEWVHARAAVSGTHLVACGGTRPPQLAPLQEQRDTAATAGTDGPPRAARVGTRWEGSRDVASRNHRGDARCITWQVIPFQVGFRHGGWLGRRCRCRR